MDLKLVKQLNIPKTPGCYKFFNIKKEIIYIGKAADLKSRVESYWQKSTQHSPAKLAMLEEIVSLELVEVETEIEAFLLEANLIKKFQPKYNIIMRDDKRHAYIKISTEDEIPGIFITREIDKVGKYFGPFTSTQAVKETLKALRKIWPYCTERKVKKKPCFYAQIGRCTGVCGGGFDIKEYKEKIIKPIIFFLEGKKKTIIKNYESRIKNQVSKLGKINNLEEQNILENEVKKLKYELLNMRNVLEHVHILSLHDKYASDVVELAKLLQLPQVPNRIEGYDISNIFGKAAVGSMVVFENGEPNKSEYKKFKIKINDSLGDTGMLKEVMERRLAHSEKMQDTRYKKQINLKLKKIVIPTERERVEESLKPNPSNLKPKTYNWPDPDLIIIDGGKGQLNVVLKLLKKAKLDIPVIAISKGDGLRSAKAPDKLFFPGEKKPLELPLASPALHLIKRVRDEAHRFAIKYHKDLRARIFFKK